MDGHARGGNRRVAGGRIRGSRGTAPACGSGNLRTRDRFRGEAFRPRGREGGRRSEKPAERKNGKILRRVAQHHRPGRWTRALRVALRPKRNRASAPTRGGNATASAFPGNPLRPGGDRKLRGGTV